MKNGHWTDIFDREKDSRNYGQILCKGVGIFLAVLPLLIRFGYSDAWMIPEFLKKYCVGIRQMNLFGVIYTGTALLMVFLYYCSIQGDAKEMYKRHHDRNIEDDDFQKSPAELLRKIIQITDAKNIGTGDLPVSDDPDREALAYEKRFKGMMLLSRKKETTEYFFIHGKEWPDKLCIFLINSMTTRRQAIRILSEQGFDYCESDGRIVHFVKGDMHVRLAYDNMGYQLSGLEVCAGDIPSALGEETQEDLEESMEVLTGNMKDYCIEIGKEVLKFFKEKGE